MGFLVVNLNTVRNGLRGLPPERQLLEARRAVKVLLGQRTASGGFSDGDFPDLFVNGEAVRRFLDIEPPPFAVIPEFQEIIDEIEVAYVGGLYFAALAAACVSIERMLNRARIDLHQHHAKIKKLWNKGATDSWLPNIEALRSWGYLTQQSAEELAGLYELRCRYLHSGEIKDLRADARRAVRAAYALIGSFLGLPADLFKFGTGGVECLNMEDPRFRVFYEKQVRHEDPASRA